MNKNISNLKKVGKVLQDSHSCPFYFYDPSSTCFLSLWITMRINDQRGRGGEGREATRCLWHGRFSMPHVYPFTFFEHIIFHLVFFELGKNPNSHQLKANLIGVCDGQCSQ